MVTQQDEAMKVVDEVLGVPGCFLGAKYKLRYIHRILGVSLLRSLA